jgi:ADP-heptose:LPS heptosyltransferase
LRFDVSINFSDNDRNVIYAGWIGARHRLGRSHGRKHFWSRWCIPTWVTATHPDEPSFEQRRLLLAQCGFQVQPAKFGLRIPEDAKAWAKNQVPEGALHFSLNAAAPLREWPLGHWIELAKRLSPPQGCFRIVTTASEVARERGRLEAFAAALVGRPEVQVFSGLPIARVVGLMNQCALHIGSDTGALHLAVALGLPTISFFRNFPGHRRWVPRGPQHRSFTVKCPCVGQKHPACMAEGAPRCLTEVTPETVATAALQQLAARRGLRALPGL